MNGDLLTEAAFAIYREFCREPDPRRARQRFDRLKPVVREQFDAEAMACIRICEVFGMELRA